MSLASDILAAHAATHPRPAADALALVAGPVKWPFPREEMTEPGLIVLRMLDDLHALAARGEARTPAALVALGWPEAMVEAHYLSAADDIGVEVAFHARRAAPPCSRAREVERLRMFIWGFAAGGLAGGLAVAGVLLLGPTP